VVPSGAPSGHKLINCVARVGSRSGSTVGYNLLRMEEQWVRPIVCAPVTTNGNQTCMSKKSISPAVGWAQSVTLGKKCSSHPSFG